MHGGQAGDRDGVQERENVRREELVNEHAHKAVPEESERLGALQALPVKSLEGFDRRKSAPVDCFDVPYGNRTQHTADTIAKESNGDGAQDDGGGAQRQVVEEILGSEDGDTGRSVGSRGSCDGTHSVLLKIPWPRVDEGSDGNPQGRLSHTTPSCPSSLQFVTTREECSPSITNEVRDEDDEGSRDCCRSWFELIFPRLACV